MVTKVGKRSCWVGSLLDTRRCICTGGIHTPGSRTSRSPQQPRSRRQLFPRAAIVADLALRHPSRSMVPRILKDGGAQGQLQSRPVETIVDVNEVAVASVTSSIQECGFRRYKCICECPIMNPPSSFVSQPS